MSDDANLHGHSKVATLLAVADRESRARRWLPAVSMFVALQVAIVSAFPHSPVAVFCYASGVGSMIFFLARFGLRYRGTTKALAAANDVRMIGPLVDRLRSARKPRRTRRVVRNALIRLLPRLKAGDASLLTREQHTRLSATLRQLGMLGRDCDLQIAILEAFKQIGGLQALPVVQGLARNRSHSPKRQRVRAAARECLPYLIERAQNERSRETLLRAAYSVHDIVGLLRPAAGVCPSEPLELLRAVE